MLKVGTFKKRDEQVSKSKRNGVLDLFHGLRKLRMNRERSLLGAGCAQFSNFNKSRQKYAAKSIENYLLYHHLIRVTEFHNDSVVLCVLPWQTVSWGYELAWSHLFLSAIGKGRCDRLLTPRFSAHVAWSLFDLVPWCVCLLWWLACVRLCVVRVGVRRGLNPEWFGLKLRFAQINGSESKARKITLPRCLLESTSNHNTIFAPCSSTSETAVVNEIASVCAAICQITGCWSQEQQRLSPQR